MTAMLSESMKSLVLQNQMLHERLVEREKDAYDAKSRRILEVEKTRNVVPKPPRTNGVQLGIGQVERDEEIARQISELETNVMRTS